MSDVERKAAATILIGIMFIFGGLVLVLVPWYAEQRGAQTAGLLMIVFGLCVIVFGIYKFRKGLSKDMVKEMVKIFGRARVPDL